MTDAKPDRMLLRRMSHHLRRQDWFLVATEFIVVVVGVFLGLQVSNWNEERQERQDEQAILQRLHDEAGNLLEVVQAERLSMQARADALISAQPVLYSVEAERPLTQTECDAIVSSHVYRKPSDELPILDELIATGRFNYLQNADIRQELRAYILFRDRQRGIHDERTNELFRLYSRYPEAVSLGLVPADGDDGSTFSLLSDPGYQWRASCNVAMMRANQPFLNEFFDNMGRNGNILDAYIAREEMLSSLQERLAALMGT